VLELDQIRRVVTPRPTYSAEEREVLYRALAYMAMLLHGEGVNVIVDATAHRRRFRDVARALVPTFAEVYLSASLDRCRVRAGGRRGGFAPEDVYGQAGLEGSTVPGVDEAYEPPLHPELILDTEKLDVANAAERLVGFLEAFRGAHAAISGGGQREGKRTGEEGR
jgi:adenylylsulfate kinase